MNFGLLFSDDGSSCVGYSDADWGGDVGDRKSTSGYLFQIGGTAVSWKSNKQTCVALSTTEAEYIALAAAAQEAIWLRQLTTDLKNGPVGVTMIFGLQSAWPRTHSSMGEANTLRSSITSSEITSAVGVWN